MKSWFTVHKGYVVGPTREWDDHPMWKEDPAMAPFRTAAQSQKHLMGFAGHPTSAPPSVEQVHSSRDVRTGLQRKLSPKNR